jgi:hypothetical protein
MKPPTDLKASKECCCECGRLVSLGSGLFVNRVMVFDDYQTKVESGCLYPEGEFICPECEAEMRYEP